MDESTPEPRSWLSRCGDATPTDVANLKRLLWGLVVWAICLTGVTQLVKRELVDGALAWALALLPLAAGVIVAFAYRRYLEGADDLQRLIHLRALGLGFAGAWLASFSSQIFERLGAPELAIDNLMMIMTGCYVLGIFLGWKRYR